MKKVLSLALALVICLGLTIPAAAVGKAGDTTITDVQGVTYTLSNPILYTIQLADTAKIILADSETTLKDIFDFEGHGGPLPTEIYAVSPGTVLTPPADMMSGNIFQFGVEMDAGVWNVQVSGIGATGEQAFTFDPYGVDYMSQIWPIPLSDMSTGGNWRERAPLLFFTPADATAPNPFAAFESSDMPETPEEPETPTTPETPAAPASNPFKDVAADAFYADAVAWAVEKNITKGTSATAFSPNGTCKVEQILTFLWRAAGSPASAAPCPFAGLEQASPYYPALCWASEKGILKGEAVAAGMDCTRMMAVDFMYRYANSPSSGTSTAFTDVPAGHASAVGWAVENGVTKGTSGTTFSPEKTCTRGEIVTFLYRAFSEK